MTTLHKDKLLPSMKSILRNRPWLRIGFLIFWLIGIFTALSTLAAEPRKPIVIGLTAEFGVQGSHAAQSIEKGIALAIDEINAAGGLPDGRKLELATRDDRGVPARGVDNFVEFAANPDIVAVFCGRFSPVALEIFPHATQHRLLLLDPWAAADAITAPRDNQPGYVFRLSMTDTWAIEAMLDHARKGGLKRFALLVPNTAWGRSSEAALLAYQKSHAGLSSTTYWYNWGETDFADRLDQASRNGAQALLMVANEAEGLPIVKQMAAQPPGRRLPVFAHWGILAGDFGLKARPHLDQLDFSVAHTFSFKDARQPKARQVEAGIRRLFAIDPSQLPAQVGFAHAYDLTHLLARAIVKAGSTDRAALRDALEQLGPYDGLVRRYDRPFTRERHEALAVFSHAAGRAV